MLRERARIIGVQREVRAPAQKRSQDALSPWMLRAFRGGVWRARVLCPLQVARSRGWQVVLMWQSHAIFYRPGKGIRPPLHIGDAVEMRVRPPQEHQSSFGGSAGGALCVCVCVCVCVCAGRDKLSHTRRGARCVVHRDHSGLQHQSRCVLMLTACWPIAARSTRSQSSVGERHREGHQPKGRG